MRHYLATVHTRSHSHKKRFAFLISGGITLSIFMIWSLFTFSSFGNDATLAENAAPIENTGPSPFESLQGGVAASVASLKDQFNAVKGNVKAVNLQSEYERMRTDALNSNSGTSTYGN
ncbi:MAG: hypothetical protein JWN89_302 [Parcubacteria group bacterium]|nr:hypothetical protein [Parcubacteria group bacterium]